jgi:hypothetical protein
MLRWTYGKIIVDALQKTIISVLYILFTFSSDFCFNGMNNILSLLNGLLPIYFEIACTMESVGDLLNKIYLFELQIQFGWDIFATVFLCFIYSYISSELSILVMGFYIVLIVIKLFLMYTTFVLPKSTL